MPAIMALLPSKAYRPYDNIAALPSLHAYITAEATSLAIATKDYRRHYSPISFPVASSRQALIIVDPRFKWLH
jgi:hypothetical protein